MKFLQTDFLQAETLLRAVFTQQKLFRTEAFTHKKNMHSRFLQTDGFYTESSPHRSLTHRRFYAQFFYIQTFLPTDVFTQRQIAHRNWCTQHAFTHSPLLHREALLPLLDHLPFVFPSQVKTVQQPVSCRILQQTVVHLNQQFPTLGNPLHRDPVAWDVTRSSRTVWTKAEQEMQELRERESELESSERHFFQQEEDLMQQATYLCRFCSGSECLVPHCSCVLQKRINYGLQLSHNQNRHSLNLEWLAMIGIFGIPNLPRPSKALNDLEWFAMIRTQKQNDAVPSFPQPTGHTGQRAPQQPGTTDGTLRGSAGDRGDDLGGIMTWGCPNFGRKWATWFWKNPRSSKIQIHHLPDPSRSKIRMKAFAWQGERRTLIEELQPLEETGRRCSCGLLWEHIHQTIGLAKVLIQRIREFKMFRNWLIWLVVCCFKQQAFPGGVGTGGIASESFARPRRCGHLESKGFLANQQALFVIWMFLVDLHLGEKFHCFFSSLD